MDMNKVHYGDCMELAKKVPDESVDLIVTSPPYAKMVSYGENVKTFEPEMYGDWFLPLVKEAARFLKETGSFIMNINDQIMNGERSIYVYDLICRIARETDLKFFDRYIWTKKSGLPSGGKRRLDDKLEYIFHFVRDPKKYKCYTDRVRVPYKYVSLKRMEKEVGIHDSVDSKGKTSTNLKKINANPLGKVPTTRFEFNTAGVLKGGAAGKHPAPFHPDMPAWFIKWLTDEGDVVLDPFMGGGTTAGVCKRMNRNWIGFELNIEYKELIDWTLENCYNINCTYIDEEDEQTEEDNDQLSELFD